jgi:hypothetical protein
MVVRWGQSSPSTGATSSKHWSTLKPRAKL